MTATTYGRGSKEAVRQALDVRHENEMADWESTMNAVTLQVLPTDEELAALGKAAAAPVPDAVMSAFYGTEDWHRVRPGMASLLSLIIHEPTPYAG